MKTIPLKLAVLAGIACIVWGAWQVYGPAGWIALGVGLLVVGIGST